MKFSIGIPAFKAKYFKECIDSVLNQSFTNFELLILNDASPENIKEIIEEYSDHRIKYLENEVNCGALNVVDNWNKLLNISQGDYFMLLGDDDVLQPDYLQQFHILIKRFPEYTIYHCRSVIIDGQSIPSTITEPRPEWESVLDMIWGRLNNGRTQFISDFLYDSHILKASGGYIKIPLAWGTDDITAYNAALSKGIINTNEVLLYYRRSSINISASIQNIDDKLKAIDLEVEWINKLLNSYPTKTNVDKVLTQAIKDTLPKYIKKKKMYLISKTMVKKPFVSLTKWLMDGKKYRIDRNIIIYAFIEGIKVRKSQKSLN